MNHVTIPADEVERALAEACRRAHAEILGFTVAPRRVVCDDPWDGHDWLIEFAEPPRAPDLFPRVLDDVLCRLHPAYRAARLLERVADHATNIAEMVIYLVESRMVRHTLA